MNVRYGIYDKYGIYIIMEITLHYIQISYALILHLIIMNVYILHNITHEII